MKRQFEILTVNFEKHGVRWHSLCRCSCGREFVSDKRNLASGNTRSCGCLRRRPPEVRIALSNPKQRAYWRWTSMIQRCYNKSAAEYKNYGARGITVSSSWLDSFESYYADMGEPPFPEATIDRIDNDGPYCKENCQWASPQTQATNRRTNRIIQVDGIRDSAAAWARLLGVRTKTVCSWHIKGYAEEQIRIRIRELA